jgi:hypothetical protein
VELQTTSTDYKVDSSCTKPLFYFLLMPAPGSRQMQTTFLSDVPSDGTSSAGPSAELGIYKQLLNLTNRPAPPRLKIK